MGDWLAESTNNPWCCLFFLQSWWKDWWTLVYDLRTIGKPVNILKQLTFSSRATLTFSEIAPHHVFFSSEGAWLSHVRQPKCQALGSAGCFQVGFLVGWLPNRIHDFHEDLQCKHLLMDHSNRANNLGCTKKYTTIFSKNPYEWWGEIIALKLVGLITWNRWH